MRNAAAVISAGLHSTFEKLWIPIHDISMTNGSNQTPSQSLTKALVLDHPTAFLGEARSITG